MKRVTIIFIFLLLISIFPTFLLSYSNTEGQYVIASIFIPPKDISQIYSLAYEVSNPNSPLYHHFLNSSEIMKFMNIQEYEAMLSFLKSHGIKIISTSLDSIIVVNVSILQLEEFLNTTVFFNKFQNYTYYSGIGYLNGNVIVASNFTTLFLKSPDDLVTPSLINQIEKKAITLNFTYADESYPVTWLLKAYNATVLNTTGEGYTIGILDFYGDPTIVQQLAYFDKIYNLPSPSSFEIKYIGPSCPFGGLLSGWNLEISLDVEVSHAMAPKASIILYVANPNLPLPAVLAKIVQEDKINVLSQSWGIPESEIVDNPANLMTVYEMNLYYALGSLEGITFLASTGDVGGSGYSTSPIGSVTFPSTSPFVTAIGGTTTYITLNGSAYQTAWSNYGFIPYFINYGGSTGGISVLFVKPWYQFYIPTPNTYPYGRMVPDISLNANLFPGIQVVFPGNITYLIGGTSEASPLFAGLLTLVMQKDNMTFGLINPLLYYLGEKYYNEAYFPITFGYNIPWVAKYGYNLVTGLGAPNIGEIAHLVKLIKSSSQPEITISLYNGTNYTYYFLPDQEIEIIVNATENGKEVTSGSFNAYVYSLSGEVADIKLHFNGSRWIGYYYPTVEGPIEVIVNNESGTTAFVGYILTIKGNLNTIYPEIRGEVYNLYDERVNVPYVNVTIYAYQPLNNSYVKITNIIMNSSKGEYIAYLGRNITAGPILIVGNNVYGYIPTFAGSSLLLNTLIIPPLVVEPGVVTPGSSLFIEPSNIPFGNTNISAVLYSNDGKVLSVANLSWVLVPFEGLLAYAYIGYLKIPYNITPGLYTIILNQYSALGNSSVLEGRYYSQIYVIPQNLSISVKLEGILAEGNNVKILANITYPDGTEVKYGMFSATVYPLQLQSNYEDYTESFEIPLWFNGTLWIGNFTLPSTYTQGNLTYLSGNYFGPFSIFISGISANGYPTTNNLNAQKPFIVQPYTLIANTSVTFAQTFYVYFYHDNISMIGKLFNDILENVVIYNSNLEIMDSQINGTLVIRNSNVTLDGVVGDKIIVINSTINVINSKITNITLLSNSRIANETSLIKYLSIPLPSVLLSGNEVIVHGEDIKSVEVFVNGKLVYNGTSTQVTLPLSNGYNEIHVIVVQNDGEIVSENFEAYIQSNSILTISLVLSIIAILLVIVVLLIMYRQRRT